MECITHDFMVANQRNLKPLKEIDTQGGFMNNWEIIKLVDCKGYSAFYSEEFGLVTNVCLSVYPIDKDGERLRNVYTNYDPSTGKISEDLYNVSEYSIDTFFDLKFYRNNLEEQPRVGYYNYGMPRSISKENAKKISNIKFRIGFSYDEVNIDGEGSRIQRSYIISKKEELQDITIWATKDKVNCYEMPVLMDLEVGQKYYYIGRGVCEVVEVYDYPNRCLKIRSNIRI